MAWLRLWRHKGLILLWWLAGLIVSAALLLPLWVTLRRVFGDSLAESELQMALRLEHVVDLLVAEPGALPAILAAMAGGVGVWIVLSLALSAGTLGVLVETSGVVIEEQRVAIEDRRARGRFGAAVSTWFGPFLRLELAALVMLPAVAVAPVLVMLAIRLVAGDHPSEPVDWWARRITLVLAAVGFAAYRIVVRFGRIDGVWSGERRVWRLLRRGLGRASRLWWQAALLAAVVAAVALLILAAETRLASPLVGTPLLVVALVGLQQLLAALRVSARLWRVAGEVELAERDRLRRDRELLALAVHVAADLADSAAGTTQGVADDPEAAPQDDREESGAGEVLEG